MKRIDKSAIMALTIAAGAMLPSFADRTLNDGLVAYLPFDNSLTENAVAGSPVAPEVSTATAPALANGGMVGKCLDLPNSGSGAYVKLTGTDTGSLAFEDSNASFTAVIWVNSGNQTSDPVIFGNKNWTGGGSFMGVILCGQKTARKLGSTSATVLATVQRICTAQAKVRANGHSMP